ncbi:MAG: hypothetical protein HDR19_01985 [Lachnospiraceae bacterium]|nr:hypothetical protein [Lachnospiraceae bacterium]
MKRTTRINVLMVVMTLIFIMVFSITGRASDRFKSQGKIVFNNKTVSTKDDVIFDAGDFETLAEVCK